MISAELRLNEETKDLSITLSHSQLAKLIDLLPDCSALAEAFEFLSGHSDSAVRRAVAAKSHLPKSAITSLVADPAISVVSALLHTKQLRGYIEELQLLEICHRDPSLAESVAGNFEDYSIEDAAIAEFLVTHPDREVRYALANNPFVPRPILRRLAESDPDTDLRITARELML